MRFCTATRRLDDDHGHLLLADEPLQLGPGRVEGREAKLAGRFVVDAGDALVLAEVDGDNGLGGGRIRGRRHGASSCGARGGWVVW
jgi:hypothetical protein